MLRERCAPANEQTAAAAVQAYKQHSQSTRFLQDADALYIMCVSRSHLTSFTIVCEPRGCLLLLLAMHYCCGAPAGQAATFASLPSAYGIINI
jgi:hypothetical protein